MLILRTGGMLIMILNARDLAGVLKELSKHTFHSFPAVNTLFNGLMNTRGFDRLDFSAIKVVIGGGAAVQRPVAERWKQMTGRSITEAYGLTETSPGVCANPLEAPWKGTIGLPFPSTDVSIRDERFNALPAWTGDGNLDEYTGEVCVRGPQVMKGYWNKPDETAKAMQDGWLKTGDVGHMDWEGYFTITDRKKDMIVVSGFKVFPNEIEGVVMAHPGVLECGAVGVPDPRTGEAVKVVVVKKDPSLTQQAIIEYCKTQLTAYKVPRFVEFRKSLPKSPIGKVLRRELRDAPKD